MSKFERKDNVQWLKDESVHGHYRGDLAIAAGALYTVFCRADGNNRANLIENLIEKTIEFAGSVQGHSSLHLLRMEQALRDAALRVNPNAEP